MCNDCFSLRFNKNFIFVLMYFWVRSCVIMIKFTVFYGIMDICVLRGEKRCVPWFVLKTLELSGRYSRNCWNVWVWLEWSMNHSLWTQEWRANIHVFDWKNFLHRNIFCPNSQIVSFAMVGYVKYSLEPFIVNNECIREWLRSFVIVMRNEQECEFGISLQNNPQMCFLEC